MSLSFITRFLIMMFIISITISTQSRAASQCAPELNEIIEQMISWRSRNPLELEQSCPLVSAREREPLANSMLIDIRSAPESKKSHLRNAINFPQDSVLYEIALKKKPLILLDKGYRQSQTEGLCSKLKQAGFNDVSVLDGGINALVSYNHDYLPNPNALMSLYELSFEDLTYLMINKRLTVYTANLNINPNKYILSRISNPLPTNELDKLLSGKSGATPSNTSILIIGDLTNNLEIISRYRPYLYSNVYFFSPGIEEYERMFLNWQRMLTEKKVDLRKLDRCLI